MKGQISSSEIKVFFPYYSSFLKHFKGDIYFNQFRPTMPYFTVPPTGVFSKEKPEVFSGLMNT